MQCLLHQTVRIAVTNNMLYVQYGIGRSFWECLRFQRFQQRKAHFVGKMHWTIRDMATEVHLIFQWKLYTPNMPYKAQRSIS